MPNVPTAAITHRNPSLSLMYGQAKLFLAEQRQSSRSRFPPREPPEKVLHSRIKAISLSKPGLRPSIST